MSRSAPEGSAEASLSEAPALPRPSWPLSHCPVEGLCPLSGCPPSAGSLHVRVVGLISNLAASAVLGTHQGPIGEAPRQHACRTGLLGTVMGSGRQGAQRREPGDGPRAPMAG